MRQLKKAYLEITNVCNMHCEFCPGTRREQGFLSPENFRILANRLRPHTEYLYLHLMGEPLLHPELKQILDAAEELNFKVMVTTNGTLLRERGKLICTSPAVQKVSVSLHSWEGNGRNGLDDYLEQCISFTQMASEAKKRCVLRLWNLDGPGGKGKNLRNDEILSTLKTAFPTPWHEGHRGTTLAPNVFLEWGEKFDWPDLTAPEENAPKFCYGLRDQIGVLWDGTVVPCCLDHEGDIPLGNLYGQPLEKILNSPRAQALYEGFSQRTAREALCRRCGFARRFK